MNTSDNLDSIIKKSSEDITRYLDKYDIEYGSFKLRIMKSTWLFRNIPSIIVFSSPIVTGALSYIDPSLLPLYLSTFPMVALYLWSMEDIRIPEGYNPITRTIYIAKKPLGRVIDRIIDDLSSKKINGPSVIGLNSPINNKITYPLYIDSNNIEESVAKAVSDIIIGHGISHSIVGEYEHTASASGDLIYLSMNGLYRYPEAYKIIEENVRKCKNEEDYVLMKDPNYSGSCYTNTVLHKNKFLINIREEIEKIKYSSEEDFINTIKSYKIN